MSASDSQRAGPQTSTAPAGAGLGTDGLGTDGLGVVVTGAAAGIGRAIATRLAGEGARVVVNDLDVDGSARVAEEIGGLAVGGDAAGVEGVQSLLRTARAALGRVDVYVANAGVGVGLGLAAGEEDWARAFEVNVMAHVRAARELVPGWLADGGGGRFVVTASAAGLLTMLGSPTYTVSKHGAVAFAEWLSATYGGRGIVVQALCPLGVDTRMLAESGPLKPLLTHEVVLTPEAVAEEVWLAMQDDRFLILPHPRVREHYLARVTDTERWLSGMRAVQHRLDQAGMPGS